MDVCAGDPICAVTNTCVADLWCSVQAWAYYGTHYAGEHGPYSSKQQAVKDALSAVNSAAAPGDPSPLQLYGPYSDEWGTLVYRDPYGYYWWNDPWSGSGGQSAGDRQHIDLTLSLHVQRPNVTIAVTIHSHPFPTRENLSVPDPSVPLNQQDNLNPQPGYVIVPNASMGSNPPTFSGHSTICSGSCSDDGWQRLRWFVRPFLDGMPGRRDALSPR